jgi:hypothetical protein
LEVLLLLLIVVGFSLLAAWRRRKPAKPGEPGLARDI